MHLIFSRESDRLILSYPREVPALHINNIGYNHCHDADFKICRPTGSGDYLLLLLKTPAVFTFRGTDSVARPNSFILYKKGTPQFYQACDISFANDWFHFDMSGEDLRFLEELNIPFDNVIPIGDLNGLSLIIKNMCYEKYSSNHHREDSISLYLRLFFIKLSEKLHPAGNESANSYYDKMSILRSKIYNMPYHDWNVEGLAHQLSMSKSYFQHLYKEIFGISVINDVIRSRIEHSKYLLSTTDLPITQIAGMCGYKCDLHFMRQFKTRMQMSPTEYRKHVSDDE